MSAEPLRHDYPWTPEEETYLVKAKQYGARHKHIARYLNRTPRAIDGRVARMKELGLIAMNRREELDLLDRLRFEASMPERYPK